jgi:proteasome lid subunit RPN8/RPN11
MSIPIYLKTSADFPRPLDSEFYLVAQDGLYFCRNHTFFQSDVPAKRKPRGLAPHAASCTVQFPLVPISTLEYVVAFFGKVFERFQSEAVVLLYWDTVRERYRLLVPKQKATVWQSRSGKRSPMDVAYEVPLSVPHQWMLVGDVHSHGDMGCAPSWTDKEDEIYRDGVHAIVGRVHREPPELYVALALDGSRFGLDFEVLFRGYRQRRRIVPESWLKQVEVEVQLPGWKAWTPSEARSNFLSWNAYDGE